MPARRLSRSNARVWNSPDPLLRSLHAACTLTPFLIASAGRPCLNETPRCVTTRCSAGIRRRDGDLRARGAESRPAQTQLTNYSSLAFPRLALSRKQPHTGASARSRVPTLLCPRRNSRKLPTEVVSKAPRLAHDSASGSSGRSTRNAASSHGQSGTFV